MIQNYIEKELIGIIGDRPVYTVVDANTPEIPFYITNRTLIIGDGKQTPMLIVKDALKAMFHYILEAPVFNFSGLDFPGDLGFTDKEILTYLVFKHDESGHFIYHNFTQEDRGDFKQMCKSSLLAYPYNETNILDFNTWLHINIGAFVWYYCSEITDFITFSACDYFEENYLEHINLINTSKNIIGMPKHIEAFKDFTLEHENRMRFPDFDYTDDKFFMDELLAGNNWNLDNLYMYFKNRPS